MIINRQVRRIQKAIDELIKIQDDGRGTGAVQHALDMLRDLQDRYDDNNYGRII